MVFSSIAFLSGFLLTVFLLYTIIPNIHIKNVLLILFSLLFYSVGEPVYVLLLMGSAVGNYIFGMLIGRFEKYKKIWLIAAVFANVALLIVFKYADYLIGLINGACGSHIPMLNFTMPIGISFFTFQAMSYVIDVYRGECAYQRNLFKVMLYISLFPQLIAGPIIKYKDMEAEISNRKQTLDDVEYGIRRFIVGLSKKVIISNTLAAVVDSLMKNISGLSVMGAWMIAIGYMLQIYYDFSGYSDMAIGLGRMFGFHFKENFNYPYAAGSIKDFWRRWHISLSTWFKEYVYITLGGNRKGKLRTIINKYIVFFLTGLWHGANVTFVVWGLLHGCCSVLEEFSWFKITGIKVIRNIYTILIVMCAFVIFRADSLVQAGDILQRLVGIGATGNATATLALLTPFTIFAFVIAIIFAVPWWRGLSKKLHIENNNIAMNVEYIVGGIALLLCLMFCMLRLASDAYNPFIYFRF